MGPRYSVWLEKAVMYGLSVKSISGKVPCNVRSSASSSLVMVAGPYGYLGV